MTFYQSYNRRDSCIRKKANQTHCIVLYNVNILDWLQRTKTIISYSSMYISSVLGIFFLPLFTSSPCFDFCSLLSVHFFFLTHSQSYLLATTIGQAMWVSTASSTVNKLDKIAALTELTDTERYKQENTLPCFPKNKT